MKQIVRLLLIFAFGLEFVPESQAQVQQEQGDIVFCQNKPGVGLTGVTGPAADGYVKYFLFFAKDLESARLSTVPINNTLMFDMTAFTCKPGERFQVRMVDEGETVRFIIEDVGGENFPPNERVARII